MILTQCRPIRAGHYDPQTGRVSLALRLMPINEVPSQAEPTNRGDNRKASGRGCGCQSKSWARMRQPALNTMRPTNVVTPDDQKDEEARTNAKNPHVATGYPEPLRVEGLES